MGFLNPLALLALPLAALPLVLDRMGRRRTDPITFSSLYLLERARRSPARRSRARAPWTAILRAVAIGLLVVAAARPVGPGTGSPKVHRPTRAVVAVDVSWSTAQSWEGTSAWTWISAAADSVLAAGSEDDEIALAAVADGVVGWWQGRPDGLRRRLSTLGPTGRASHWPAILDAVAARSDDGTETYLFTDGSRGARPPAADTGSRIEGHRALRVWPAPASSNRGTVDTRWIGSDAVALEARGWGPDVPTSIEAGRRVGERLLERRAIALATDPDAVAPQTWAVADTATLAIAGGDRFPDDDRIAVARGRGGPYRVARWVPPDRPPEPGTLFWEAALAAATRSPAVERFSSLPELVASSPDLVLLPLRAYRPDQAASLAALVESGSRLLFASECPDPACVPGPGWMPDPGPDVPALGWRLSPPDRTTTLAPRPHPSEEGEVTPGVPDHVAARVPVRGALRPTGGPEPRWTWELADGTTALWVRGRVGLWLVPFGPPVTRLGTTPLFPLVADAAVARWDVRWRRDGTLRLGEPVPLPGIEREATVVGPVGAESPRRWTVRPGELAPRPRRPGLYRIEAAGTSSFVAVRADPGEGDLRPVGAETWRAAWGEPPVPSEAWPEALFPRRRGPEMTAWALVLALSILALAAWAWREERTAVSEEPTSRGGGREVDSDGRLPSRPGR